MTRHLIFFVETRSGSGHSRGSAFVKGFLMSSSLSLSRGLRSIVCLALVAAGWVAVRGVAQTASGVPFRAAVTATGPIAHWPLDGGAGSDIAGSHPLVAGGSGSPSPFGGGVAVADGVAIGSTVLTRSVSASTAVWAKFSSAGTYRDGAIFETGGWQWRLNADGRGGRVCNFFCVSG
jgi:hypothetical protein